jgi:hypothetical protein
LANALQNFSPQDKLIIRVQNRVGVITQVHQMKA